MPYLLDLFCGAGGASKGYADAGFDVVGVDFVKQPNYPFQFYEMDAFLALNKVYDTMKNALSFVEDFDVIHASPPCQAFTAYNRRKGVGVNAINLIPKTREWLSVLDKEFGMPYVIENVYGAPLIDPIRLCGSSFGLDVRRHRYFETNMALKGSVCDHGSQTPRFPPASNRTNLRSTVEVGVYRIPLKVQQEAMGIDWMNLKELSQAIPPAYTQFLGQQIMEVI